MRSIPCVMAAMVSVMACNTGTEVENGPLSSLTANDLIASVEVLWKDPSNIQVCWETPESYGSDDLDPALHRYAEEKEWVRQSIADSWSVANPRIQFVGWGDCREGSEGIRIRVVSDVRGPRVSDFGRALDKVKGGVVLAFDFQELFIKSEILRELLVPCFSSRDSRKACIEGIAVHEFGHALGVRHEHERSDVEALCANRVDLYRAGVVFGEYDPLSIMNYCREDRLVNWPLSYLDRQGILALYPPSGGAPSLSEANFDWGRPSVYAYWSEGDKGLVVGTETHLTFTFWEVDGVLAQGDLSNSRELNAPVVLEYADGSRSELPMSGRWSATEGGRWPGKYVVEGRTQTFVPRVEGWVNVYWNNRYLQFYRIAANKQ